MIRPVRYRDLAAINSLYRVAGSGFSDWHASPSPQTWPSTHGTLMESLLPARSAHTYVLEEGGQVFGFIQARPRSSYDKWDIIRLVATGEHPADLWHRLLEYVCVAAGNRRVTKLFANVPEEAEELEIFRQIGFYRFTTEEALSLPLSERGVVPPMPAPLRPAEARDSFHILQLYNSVTPKNVQQAEGLTARDYEPPRGFMSSWLQRFGLAQDSPDTLWTWVAEEDGKIFAWFQLRWREGRCRMSFLVHPDRRQEFPELRDYIVGTARATRPCVLGVQVREYQQEMAPLFEEIGFQTNGRHLLLVKHIAVQVMERRLTPVLTRA
ncbi:MAG TPA: GNAT family N-acetyltransferase [Chloroflexota bacterium]